MDILRLPAYEVLEVRESIHDCQMRVRVIQKPSVCPDCGSEKIVQNGTKELHTMDLPIHGKRVGLLMQRQYYLCRHCQHGFSPELPALHSKRRVTQRLFEYVAKQSLAETFVALAEEIGVDEKTIRNLFADYLESLGKPKFQTPRWLGIDEIHLIKPRCVLTNVEARTAVDILADRTKKRVISYLAGLSDRHKIELVAIDMWRPYAEAVAYCLPQAEVVIDKFHVLRLANQAVETIRKQLRELPPEQRKVLKKERFVLLKRFNSLNETEKINLEVWCDAFPQLGQTYKLKESLFDFWSLQQSSQEALAAYTDWEAQIPTELEPAFNDLTRAVKNWQEPVFRYFDTGITNAYTEALNSLIRVTDRVGRGYSFEILRAKILYGSQLQKRGKYDRNQFKAKEPEAEYLPIEGVPIRKIPEILKDAYQ